MKIKPIIIIALLIWVLLVLATLAQAATYWVSKSGSNSNGCTNTTTPQTTGAKLTIAAGIACLSSGDTLDIRGGTYTERITTPPSGGGSYASATTIAGYPGETVIIRPTLSHQGAIDASSISYVIFQNLQIDGQNIDNEHNVSIGPPSHHVRFDNVDSYDNSKNSPSTNPFAGYFIDAPNTEIINSELHHNGAYANPFTFTGGQ